MEEYSDRQDEIDGLDLEDDQESLCEKQVKVRMLNKTSPYH